MSHPLRRHTDMLAEHLLLAGRRILDVGAGAGRLVGWMRRQGADALGLDTQAALRPDIVGVAEALPIADSCMHGVVLFNSLHHVAEDRQEAALEEAARVLRDDGVLVVVEPLAEGSYFELLRPIDDETRIRAAALSAMRRAAQTVLRQTDELCYTTEMRQASLDELLERFVAAAPERQDRIAGQRDALAARLTELGRIDGDAIVLEQPMRLCRFQPRKRA